MAGESSKEKGSHGDDVTSAEVVSKTTTQPAASPFTVQETLSRLDPARTSALKALAAGQTSARAGELSGLGPAAIKTLKEKYLPAIRQASAALEWLPGTDDVKEAASRWASQTLINASGQAMKQKNPGAVVAAIRQLDWMTGLGVNSTAGHLVQRSGL